MEIKTDHDSICDPANCSKIEDVFGDPENICDHISHSQSCANKKRRLNNDRVISLDDPSAEIIELGEFDETHEFKQELFDGEIDEIENNSEIKQEFIFMEHPNENILPLTPEAKQELVKLSLSLNKRKCL